MDNSTVSIIASSIVALASVIVNLAIARSQLKDKNTERVFSSRQECAEQFVRLLSGSQKFLERIGSEKLNEAEVEELRYRVELLYPEPVLVSLNDLIEVQASLAELLELMHNRYFSPDWSEDPIEDLSSPEKYLSETEITDYRKLMPRFEEGYTRTLRLMREQLHLKM